MPRAIWEPVGIRSLICQQCGEGFESKRSDTKFCPVCRHQSKYDRYEAKMLGTCPDCQKPITRRSGRCKACAIKAGSYVFKGESNPSWKGGQTLSGKGYLMVLNPDKTRRKSNYVGQHILVWEAAHGPSPRNGHIHHLNGEKLDNRLENLQWMSMAEHHSSKGYGPYEERIRNLEARIRELER